MTKQQLEQLNYPIIIDSAACAVVWEYDGRIWDGDHEELLIDFLIEQIEEQLTEHNMYISNLLDRDKVLRERGPYCDVVETPEQFIENFNIESIDY